MEVGDIPWGQRQAPAAKVETFRHKVIRPGDERNTLLVILRGGRRLEIYVNGIAISGSIQLAHPLAPRVIPNIVTWSRKVEISQFKLWLLPPPAPLGPGEEKHAPDLTGMKRVIVYDFSNPDRIAFEQGRKEKDNCDQFVQPGRYVLRHLPGPRGVGNDWNYCSAVVWDGLTGDVACEVVGRVLTERDAGWAVGFLTPKRDRDVAVRVRTDGALEVGSFLWNVQRPVTMVGPIRHPDILSGDKDNKLRVVLRGGQTLEVYVNGAAVTRPIQLPQRLAVVCPGVGLWERCGAPELKARAEFSRFTVWQQLPPAQAKP